MDLTPDMLKQITETFKVELEELLQIMTDGLLFLEKNDETNVRYAQTIEAIFRAAHNVKGSARSLGVDGIGDIAHHMESIFASIRKKSIPINPNMINVCLEAIDSMRSAMQAFISHTRLPFDLAKLIENLENGVLNAPRVQPDHTANIPKREAYPEPIENESMRVELANLDRVSAMLEELQVNKIAIDEHYLALNTLSLKTRHYLQQWRKISNTVRYQAKSELTQPLLKLYNSSTDLLVDIDAAIQELTKNLRPRINELTILSTTLQDEFRRIRLVPVSNLLCTFPRLVRDLSQTLSKNVEIEITGDEVKMDKMVLENLKDPLMHLIRNAIDHGIESTEIRQKYGKPEVGKIKIEVKEKGNQIQFTVTDDGAGIDVKKISAIAADKNMITQSELDQMDENEIIELIFRPGFSSKKIITDISGRGVGLDVVKSNLNNVNGSVTIQNLLGSGTSFNLRVPLTLSSEHGLMVKSGGQAFAILTSSIEKVLMIQPNDIVDVEASQAIRLSQHAIPLRSLAHILALKEAETPLKNRLPIVVLKKNTHTVALLVDEIMGEREIVIKAFNPPLVNVSCVYGGTLSGNGQVIIVLNTGDIINKALHGRINPVSLHSAAIKPPQKPRILVVDDSITTRTLEKNVLESKGYEVTVAVNGKEAWDLLQTQTFSLLITDVSMPIMDGFTLTEHVKQSHALRDLPVIIVTSLDSDAEKKRGIDVGANAYIVKCEFESSSLLDIVSQLV